MEIPENLNGKVTLEIPLLRKRWDAIRGILGEKIAIKYHLLSRKTWVFNGFRQ